MWFYYLCGFALSNICYIKKTIPVKILVIFVINSPGHRKWKCSYTLLVRVLRQTTREYNPVRRTFYGVNYMYSLAGFEIRSLLVSRRPVPAPSLGSGICCSKVDNTIHWIKLSPVGVLALSIVWSINWDQGCKKHTPPNTAVWPLRYRLHREGFGMIVPAWFLAVLLLGQICTHF